MSTKKETSVLELVINGRQAETSINGLSASVKKAEQEFRKMNQANNPKAYAEATKNIQAQRSALSEMQRSLKGVNTEATNLKTNWKDIAKGVVAGGLIQQGIGMLRDFGSQVIRTYTEFEKYSTVLANSLGSQEAARRAMAALQEFAAKTPFSLSELTESYVKFVNRGIIPTTDQLTKMGDLAASQGKSFAQLTEAILDAGTGEFERLKEFGIRASKNGDQVALSFKGVTQEVKFTDEAIQAAILTFGEMEGVADGMAKQSETLGGKISNLGDAWDQLLVTFGTQTGGVLYASISAISAYLSWVNEAFKSSEQRIQENTDKAVGNALSSLNKRTEKEQKEIIAGAKLYIQDLADEMDKIDAEIAKKDISLNEKAGGDGSLFSSERIKNDIKALEDKSSKIEQLILIEKGTLQAYADQEKQKADVAKKAGDEQLRIQKNLQEKKNDAKQKADEKAAKTAIKKRLSDIEKLKDDFNKELLDLDISKMDELDQIVAKIAQKYDPLIAKAKEFNQLNLAAQLTSLKDNTVDLSSSKFLKEDAAKQKKIDFEAAKNISADNNAAQKIGLADEDLTPEERAQREYDLETERLLSLQILYRAFDENSLEYDQALADRKVAIKQKEFEDKQALAALMLETEIQTQLATAEAVQAGASLIAGFLEQGSDAYKAFIVVEKIAAISQIIINLQKQISGIMTAAFLNPIFAIDPTGVARAAFIAKNVTVAKITAGIGIATVGAQAVGALASKKSGASAPKKEKGGFISDGPSHNQGGMKVLGRDGSVVAEIEGGEPVLSRETYRNNRETIDALLYSSQRRSGARVNFNSRAALTADTYFKSGGVITPPEWKQNVTNNSSTNVDMSSTNQLLLQLIDKVQNQEVSLNLRMLEEAQTKRLEVKNSASA